ncbi:MAG TPA: hypothetical protein VE134_04205, partial [Methanomicrobiales archaeon]|nr:hypothetical protein [Methanomicrobiales archaeon]
MEDQELQRYLKDTHGAVAVVLGAGVGGLGTVRSLGRRGIPVIAIDKTPRYIGLYSRYCQGSVCPNPLTDEEGFVQHLRGIGEMLPSRGVIIPASDPYVLSILRHRNRLDPYFWIPYGDYSTVEKITRKRLFYEELQRQHLPGPLTYFPDDISDVISLSKEISYPCVIKPSFTQPFLTEFKTKFFKIPSPQHLVAQYQEVAERGYETVVQEWIPGDDTEVYQMLGYFDSRSQPRGTFTFQKIRQYPVQSGAGSLCISKWIPEVADLSIRFLKSINYHGLLGAELKLDPTDHTYKFIEINPRLGWQHRLSGRCGIDLSYIAYRDALGEPINGFDGNRRQMEGLKWAYMVNDVRSTLHSMCTGALTYDKWMESLSGDVEYAVFAQDDPGPFFASLVNDVIDLPAWLSH